MFKLNNYVRPNILTLTSYSSARDEFNSKEGIFLDANENPFGSLNRYPDPQQAELKAVLSQLKKIPVENIFIGNGSDEVIDLTIRIFCVPGQDNIIICPPTYGMYEVAADINDVKVIKIPLTTDFQLDINSISNHKAKIIFLCSPNNPTGNEIKNLDSILQSFSGLVFIDEAYIDFSGKESMIGRIGDYSNLIISQTLSKAWGLAAARIGIAYADREIISFYNKVKPPYNVSSLNQREALQVLDDNGTFRQNVTTILSQKVWLEHELLQFDIVKKVHPSNANFILVEFSNADTIYKKLVEQGIITRNRSTMVSNCIRITVGSTLENQALINALNLICA